MRAIRRLAAAAALAALAAGCAYPGGVGAVRSNVGPGSSASGSYSSDLGTSASGNDEVPGAPSTNATSGN